jgi:hypothetical protein
VELTRRVREDPSKIAVGFTGDARTEPASVGIVAATGDREVVPKDSGIGTSENLNVSRLRPERSEGSLLLMRFREK